MKKISTTIILIFISSWLFSQKDISGLWVAYRGMGQFYGLMYIKQDSKGNIQGITYDEEEEGYCNYQLEGKYNRKTNILSATNTNLIEKSPNHIGGKYKFTYSKTEGKEYLIGEWSSIEQPQIISPQVVGGLEGVIFGGMIGEGIIQDIEPKSVRIIYERPREQKIEEIERIQYVKPYMDLEDRVSNQKNSTNSTPPSSIIPEKKEEVFDYQKPTIKPSIESPPVVISPVVQDPLVAEKKASEEFKEVKNKRKDVLLETVTSNSKEIIVYIRDYGKQDGDRISIYLDNQAIRYNMPIGSKVEAIKVTLPPDKKVHKLYFAANNLGDIPPNTAQLSLMVDGKKIQKAIFTDEKQNMYFEIKTK